MMQHFSYQWTPNEIKQTIVWLAALDTAWLAYERALKKSLGESEAKDDFDVEGEDLSFD